MTAPGPQECGASHPAINRGERCARFPHDDLRHITPSGFWWDDPMRPCAHCGNTIYGESRAYEGKKFHPICFDAFLAKQASTRTETGETNG